MNMHCLFEFSRSQIVDFREERKLRIQILKKKTCFFLVSDCVKRKSGNNVNSIFRGEENFQGRIQEKTHSPPPSHLFSCILIVKSL